MGDNVILLLCVMLMPIMMMLTGLFVWKFPAEYRGLGYHTPMAEKSPLTWRMAQIVGGKAFFFCFLPMLPLSAIAQLMPIILNLSEEAGGGVCIAVTFVQVLMLAVPITITERTLKKHFDKNGNPKSIGEQNEKHT